MINSSAEVERTEWEQTITRALVSLNQVVCALPSAPGKEDHLKYSVLLDNNITFIRVFKSHGNGGSLFSSSILIFFY